MEQTIQKLENVLEPLNLVMESMQTIAEKNIKKTEIEKRLERLEADKTHIIFPIIIFPVLVGCVIEFIGHIIIGVIIGILGAYVSYLLLKNMSRKQMIRNDENLEQCNTQIVRAEAVIMTQAPSIRENIDIVPVDYRYPLAVEYIYKCLKNQRAATIGEAINLYEDQIHKWKMESMQQEIMQTCLKQQQDMKQIKNLSAISAAAGIASLF